MHWGTFMGHCSLSEFDIASNSSSYVLMQEGFMRRRQAVDGCVALPPIQLLGFESYHEDICEVETQLRGF